MKMPPVPRMKEVAARAGVSTATVSRAMSQPERVSADVRERIETAVRELGYTINVTARSLRRSNTNVVLAVIPDIANIFFAMLLKGIEQQARELGYAVLIVNEGSEGNPQGTAFDQLRNQRAAGALVLNGRMVGNKASVAFKGAHHVSRGPFVPVIAISERVPGGCVPLVGIDNVTAARRAVEYLVGQGHRRIAHVAGPAGNPLTADRLSGFQQALGAAGIPIDPSYVVEGDFSIESGCRACRALLAHPRRPTAVFASNDAMAIGIIAECQIQGVAVPQQLSVVGFDDIELAAVLSPGITTVRQPRYEMGRTAMAMLAEAMRSGKMLGRDVLLETEFVVRGSTALQTGL